MLSQTDDLSGQNGWDRFRHALPSFLDVVGNNEPSPMSNAFMRMSSKVHKLIIESLQDELEKAHSYKSKYEKLMHQMTEDNKHAVVV